MCCDKCANGCIVNLFCITALYNDFPQTIIDKLCLDLNGSWNKEALPHLGRHPNDYHKFVMEEMDKAADMAGKNFSRIDIVSYYKDRKKYPTCNTAYLATTNGTFMKCIYRKNIDKWMVYSFKGGKYQLPSDANDPTHNKYTYQLITEKFYSTKKFYEIFKSLSKYLGKGEYFK